MECSEQSAGILVQLVLCVVVAYNVPPVTLQEHTMEPVCQFAGEPTGRDAQGVQTFEYGRVCYE